MRKQEWVSTRNERFSSLELKWRVWNTQPITVFVFRFFCFFVMSLVQSQSAVSKCIIYISVLFITKCLLCDIPLSSVPQCSWHWCTFSKKKTKELANRECQTHQNRHFDQKNIREREQFSSEKAIRNCFDFASLRVIIGIKKSQRHLFNQIDAKSKPIATCLRAFSALCSS